MKCREEEGIGVWEKGLRDRIVEGKVRDSKIEGLGGEEDINN